MAEERDETLVTINLDAPRQYRDRETMIVRTLEMGSHSVPRYVAERWGFTDAEDAPQAEPMADYGDLTVEEIKQRLGGLTQVERETLRAYEEAQARPRKGVLSALDAQEEEPNTE